MTVLVVVLVVLVLAAAGAAAVASGNRRKFARANEVVPGAATEAPAAWAGAHSPEARLHRRLRDAVSALRANPALEGVGQLESRVSLEQHALAIDQRLIAVAALPEAVRAGPLGDVAAAVGSMEQAVASLVAGPVPAERSALDQAMAQVGERVELLAQARAELTGPAQAAVETGPPPPAAQPGTG